MLFAITLQNARVAFTNMISLTVVYIPTACNIYYISRDIEMKTALCESYPPRTLPSIAKIQRDGHKGACRLCRETGPRILRYASERCKLGKIRGQNLLSKVNLKSAKASVDLKRSRCHCRSFHSLYYIHICVSACALQFRLSDIYRYMHRHIHSHENRLWTISSPVRWLYNGQRSSARIRVANANWNE